MICQLAATVFVAGCIGGSVTGFIAHARNNKREGTENASTAEKARKAALRSFVYKNPGCETVFAGFVGNVLLGGLAALVYWGLYGPFSGFTVLGPPLQAGSDLKPFLTLGQVAGSIVLGLGGPGFLLAEAERRCCERSQ